jgi:hypothetical protein
MRTIEPQRKRRYFGMTAAQIGILAFLLIIACAVFAGGAVLLLSGTAPSTSDAVAVDQQPPQPQATPTPVPTPTPEPTPTSLPDLSGVVIALEDLPSGFEAVPSDELNLAAILSEKGFTAGSSFAFIEREQFELVMGFTGLLLSKYERSDFDQQLDYPDYLLDSIVKGIGAADVLEQKTLPGLEGVGDTSAGVTLAVVQEGVPMRVDVVMFRRGMVGAVAYVLYADGAVPVVPLSDIARTLDVRIVDALPSTE